MTARPIATSTISFGLVSLPVKLYSTGESSSKVRFNWINRDTGSRVKQQYVDSQTGDLVPRENMIKGYEFAKNQYVTFEPDELKAIEAQSTEAIEITEFVPSGDIERIYLDKAYYLGPAKGGARAYRLLAAALTETDRVAIAKYSARGKQYLVMIRPHGEPGEGLILEQLLYPDELRSFDEVPQEDGEVDASELQLAKQLIEQAGTQSFAPEQYRDDVRERVLALIEKKIEGEQITLAPQEEPETKIIDLMEALKASLDTGSTRKGPARSKGKKKATEKKASSG
ncbi:MAG: Ku protein [Longimicrobiales bacterium]